MQQDKQLKQLLNKKNNNQNVFRKQKKSLTDKWFNDNT